jgi:hypothetical protein
MATSGNSANPTDVALTIRLPPPFPSAIGGVVGVGSTVATDEPALDHRAR